MIYLVENFKDGALIAITKNYKKACIISENKLYLENIDTYIVKVEL